MDGLQRSKISARKVLKLFMMTTFKPVEGYCVFDLVTVAIPDRLFFDLDLDYD